MALNMIARDINTINEASVHLPIASGAIIVNERAVTTESTMAVPAKDERGGVSIEPEKKVLCFILSFEFSLYLETVN